MISWIGAVYLVLGVVVLLRLFGLVEKSGDVVNVARGAFVVILNSALSDEAKEAALQRDAKQLLRLFLALAFGGAAAVLLPVGLLWVCDRVGWISLESVFSVAVSPVFLITIGALAVLALCFPRSKVREKTGYSVLDRCFYRVAFKTYRVQASLADLEDRLFVRQLAACRAERPVFITALPRAGTTLLLECCAKLPEFASHCYRDMPFVPIPCLWARFSATFSASTTKTRSPVSTCAESATTISVRTCVLSTSRVGLTCVSHETLNRLPSGWSTGWLPTGTC